MRQTSAREIKDAIREMHRQIRIARDNGKTMQFDWRDIAIARVLAINVNRGEYIANEMRQNGFHVFTSYEG